MVKVTLGEVCSKATSKYAQKDLDSLDGEYPIYGASGFIKYINEYQQNREYVAVVKDGAGVGRTMFLPAKSSVIGTIQYLIPNESIYAKYLYYVVKGLHLEKYYTGATIPHIYFKDYQKSEINLYCWKEQCRIVSLMEKIENIIENRKNQLAELDTLVKARFVEMFGDIPDEEKVTMVDVCKIITDGTHQPPQFEQTGIPFLFVQNIVTNEVHYDAEKFISEETYANLIKRTPIAIGDVLLSTVGSYGHPAVVKSERPFCFQRHIAYLKPDAEKLNSEYLRGAILSADVQRQIGERVKGIAQKTLNLSEIRKLRFPLPSMEKQEQFAAFVEQIDKSKVAVQRSLAEAELLFAALMQEYFG